MGPQLREKASVVVPKIGKIGPGPFITINESIESDLKMMDDGLNFI